MPSEDTKILRFNQNQNLIKHHLLFMQILGSENSCTTKVSKHIPSGFSMCTISSFRYIENKHDIYRSEDCMKKLCEYLREHTMKIIDFKKKTMKSLTKEQQESYENTKVCYSCIGKFENKYLKTKKYCKVRDHCHYTGECRDVVHSICNLKYRVPKRISIVFHNGSYYDYHFIIKDLPEEFKEQFIFLGENTEKYITFTVSIEKKVARIDKSGEEITKAISYILRFTDSARFTASSLSNLVNNFSKGIHRLKCQFGHDDKKCEICRNKYKYCDCFLEHTNFKR